MDRELVGWGDEWMPSFTSLALQSSLCQPVHFLQYSKEVGSG